MGQDSQGKAAIFGGILGRREADRRSGARGPAPPTVVSGQSAESGGLGDGLKRGDHRAPLDHSDGNNRGNRRNQRARGEGRRL
jgi:hypothetical protein